MYFCRCKLILKMVSSMQIVRKTVAELREAYHRQAGREDYQFRLGEEFVVDATTDGGMARYINHSCDPNCYTEQCSVDGQLHLGVFALRTINEGEELSYDYKVGGLLHFGKGFVECRMSLLSVTKD
jgi:hypothetical protein